MDQINPTYYASVSGIMDMLRERGWRRSRRTLLRRLAALPVVPVSVGGYHLYPTWTAIAILRDDAII